jgi:putative ABC transport system permease protein
MLQELRFAYRALLRSRGYAGAAVITLALGLGVNIAVTTVAWSVLLRPVPIAEPSRVVMIYPASSALERVRRPIAFLKFREWQARNSVFDEVAVSTPLTIQLSDARGHDIEAAAVSDNFLRLLGVRPAEGRWLEPGDRNGAEGAVPCVVSAPFARRIFGRMRPTGRRIEIVNPDESHGRTTILVVGVMPDGFERWRDSVDVWLPAEAPHIVPAEQLSSAGYETFCTVGRLRSGVTIDQAGGAMSQLDRDVERQLDGLSMAPPPLRIVPLRDDVVPPALQRTLVLFSIAAALVLAIAIANASSLVLARLETRRTEVFIRAAIGASNADLFRYAMAETIVLAAGGTAVGVPLAYWSLRFLGALAPTGVSGQAVVFGGTIAAYTIVVTLAVAILLAALQRFTLSRAAREPGLRLGTPAATAGSSRLLDLLVGGEVAVAVVVVIAGVLVVRNFVDLLYIDPGFQPAGVLLAKLEVDSAGVGAETIARDRQVAVLTELIRERVLAVPGVVAAAVTRRAPLEATGLQRASIWREDGARFLNGSRGDEGMTPDLIRAGPGYFEALGIPLRAGRGFTQDDGRVQEPVVIVNEAMARQHWPGQNPVGKRLKYRMRTSDPWAVVVGVVGDVRSRNLHDPPRPQLYSPLSESSQIAGVLNLVVKTRQESSTLAPAVFTALRELSPRVRTLGAQPMEDIFRLSLINQEYQSDLIGSFAALALVLASAGIYGLLNYRVARRRREMAIRMALGATRLDVAQMVLRRSAALVLPGLAVGVATALATTRVLRSLLFGISTTDPLTFTLVPTLFIVVAAMASLAPARRAVSGDVAVTLRED